MEIRKPYRKNRINCGFRNPILRSPVDGQGRRALRFPWAAGFGLWMTRAAGVRMSFADLRRDYGRHGLTEAEMASSPTAQLRLWLDAAVAAGVPDANAMVLATATPDGRPSARVVLLKGLNNRGLTFFSNYLSRKGRELAANPWAAITFFWPELERQVRAEGAVELVTAAESDDYFRSRPADSQMSVWVSDQSEVVAGGRAELERRFADVAARFGNGNVPRPPHWGGYRLVAATMEFWQGRPGRLHDRLRYLPAKSEGEWRIDRLSP
jgi:pyridoxamine 5'-phosphate oxidase